MPDSAALDRSSPTPPIVVIGASAGGVTALSTLVAGLGADLPAAVCIVLHISPHSPSRLADVLAAKSSLPVSTAVDGEPIRSGRIYVPSADRHLMIDGDVLRLTRGPKECRTRPAVDVLFRSAAASAGPRTVGVVLTGMLDDGTAGLWSIKDRGGQALVQRPDTAEQSSMPASAATHVAIDASLPVEELAGEIMRRVQAIQLGDMQPPPPPDKLSIETSIAAEGNGLAAGVMDLGEVSKFTCPDCHGVMVQLVEGPVVRFRCHTGHAFSMMTLLSEVNEAIDVGLWSTLRAIEERAMLLKKMAGMARDRADAPGADAFEDQASDALRGAETIRALVLDATFFGHGPQSPE